MTAQTVPSEFPRPQPRGSKNSVSLGTVDDDTGDISDEFDTTVKRNRTKTTSGKKKPKPGGTTRRTWPLDQEKKPEETIPRRDEARATAWPSSSFGGNEKVLPCFKVAGYQR